MVSVGTHLLILAELWTLSSCLLHQYHFVNKNKNWTEAQKFCRDTYTDLATVTNKEDINKIIDIAENNTYTGNVWIGLYNDASSWRWSLTGDAFYGQGESEFRNWVPGQPQNITGEQTCGQITSNGLWKDDYCGNLEAFICYNQGQDSFELISNVKNWTDAQRFCREHHTDLASVRNLSENQRLQNLVPAGADAWIGLFRGAWKWSDGHNSTWFDLERGGNGNPQENCGELLVNRSRWNGEMGWNGVVCSIQMPFFCYTVPGAHVICAEKYMAISLERIATTGPHEDYLRLNDPNCKLSSNNTHVLVNTSLNACGTVMEDDGVNLIFKNQVVSVTNTSEIITRKHNVVIEFYCMYPKQSEVNQFQFKAHRPPITFIQKGFGTFTYQFEFFETHQFSQEIDPNTYPLEFDLGEMMYMQIESNSSVPNTELFAESCSAAPSENQNETISYPIIQNGCMVDDTVQFYSSHQSKVQLGMRAFKFIGTYDQVFITCLIILCKAGEPGSRCSLGCTNSSTKGRRKREAPIQTAKHYISQGPLRLRRDVASTVANNTVNLNLVFVVGGLLATVAMVCGVLLYKTGGSEVKYERVSSSEMY